MRSLLTFALAGILAAGGAIPADAAGNRQDVLDLVRTDDASALAAVRSWVETHPGDAVMGYNLACLLARDGQAPAALAALRTAVGAGFDDADRMLADPDLAPLRGAPAFTSLAAEVRSALVLKAAAQGLELAAGTHEVRPLLPDPYFPAPATATGPAALPALTVGWNRAGLDLALAGATDWGRAPSSQPRVIVALGTIEPETACLSTDAWLLAFGPGVKGKTWGALWLPDQFRWQPVADLGPVRETDGTLRITVPWQIVQPLHPFTDPTLGLNVTVIGEVDPAAGLAPVHSLLPDPAAGDPAATAHRVAPLRLSPAGQTEPALVGRVDDTLVQGGVLDLELVVVSPSAGQGVLAIDFLDNRQRSMLPDGPRAGTVPVQAGVQTIRQQATFAGLRTGAVQLRVQFELPGAEPLVWGASLLNLAPGWRDSLAARCAVVAEPERRTVDHFLAASIAAVAAHRPRQAPGAIAKTLGDLDMMLDRAASGRSIWAPGRPGVAVYAGPDGQDRLASIYDSRGEGEAVAVLLLPDQPGGEDWLCERIGRLYDQKEAEAAVRRRPAYLVPHLPLQQAPADAAREAAAALAFLRQRFPDRPVMVAGVDGGSAAALRLAVDPVTQPAALMVLAGSRVDPWPGSDDATLAAALAALPPGLPVEWTRFPDAIAGGGRADAVLGALRRAGLPVDVRDAGGSPAPAQAADRTVLWAEGGPLPRPE